MPARRVAGARRVEGSRDDDRADAAAGDERGVDAEIGELIVYAGAARAIDQSRTNRVRPGSHRHSEAADVSGLQLRAIERDVDRRASRSGAARPGAADAE